MNQEPECPVCADFSHDEAEEIRERHGEYHWHCSRCLKVSGQQGHYMLLPDDTFGFSCEER